MTFECIHQVTDLRDVYAALNHPETSDLAARTIVETLSVRLAHELHRVWGAAIPVDARVLVVVVLRGGLLMHSGFVSAFPGAATALVAVSRAGDDRIVAYAQVPPGEYDAAIYVDPVIGSGATLLRAREVVDAHTHTGRHVVAALCGAKPGVDALARAGFSVLGISLDELDQHGLVIPDLGSRDAGDLAFRLLPDAPTKSFPIEQFDMEHGDNVAEDEARVDIVYRETLRLAAQHKPTRALDVGCGTGGLTVRLAQYASSVLGVDSSIDAIRLANARHGDVPNVSFRCLDEGGIGFEIADFAVVCMVLSVVDNLREFVGSVRSACTAGATQVWTIPHPAFQYNTSQWAAKRALTSQHTEIRYSAVPSYFGQHVWHKRVGEAIIAERHRTIAEYVSAFRAAGLTVNEMFEPAPTIADLGRACDHLVPRVLVFATSERAQVTRG